MTQVKICGITNEEDALCAVECGAAALGFIFYLASPRYIAPEKALSIIKKLQVEIIKVGVFVNEVAEEVKRISELCNLDFIQLHGDESPDYCRNFPQDMIIKAVNLEREADLANAGKYDVAALLVDSRHAGLYGGTGKKANWDLALQIKSKRPLILSGGLNEDNIKEALQIVAPQALDINSGVEMQPGKKDHKKISRVMEVVREVNLRQNNAPLIFTKREVR
jgi:phosphoribosylanthranilate isomerase